MRAAMYSGFMRICSVPPEVLFMLHLRATERPPGYLELREEVSVPVIGVPYTITMSS